MERRKLEDLNLLDDFLFGKMVTHPDFGEEFVRDLLKIIFQKNFSQLIVVPQKTYYGLDTDKHGARLDVFLEEVNKTDTGKATVYDVEPDHNLGEKYRSALPKRTRFYHAKIDSGCLKAGEDYQNLKNVIVIMITPYDPFDLNRMVYTIKNGCMEEPDMPYDDGARTLYLYTRGIKGNPTVELCQLLHYMEDTRTENATTETLQKIDQMVCTVKADREVSLEYMKIFEREKMLVEHGQDLEREKTKLARQDAENERRRAEEAERKVEMLKKELEQLKKK